jgi:hypothetical protein
MSGELWYTETSESDHDVTLALVGDVESLRPRMVAAVEKLGYKVMSENPLQAKRGAQGGARYDCSFEPLDYPTKLTINLKQLNSTSVIATFYYEVKSHSLGLSEGDRQTLLRESQAIAALSTQRNSAMACSSCGTELTDDSRFCRRCGAPLTGEIAEVEVWRLTKGARASLHDIVAGTSMLLLTALIVSLIFYFTSIPKLEKATAIIGLIIGSFGLWALIEGIWQLHRVLNSKKEKPIVMSALRTKTEATQTTTSLQPPKPVASITEGTTELLIPQLDDSPVAVPIERKRVDTSEVG